MVFSFAIVSLYKYPDFMFTLLLLYNSLWFLFELIRRPYLNHENFRIMCMDILFFVIVYSNSSLGKDFDKKT